jgi:geranylgeranyl diphosphate synthase type I
VARPPAGEFGDSQALAAANLEWWSVSALLDGEWSLFASVWCYRGFGNGAGLTAAYALTPTSSAGRHAATWVDAALLAGTRGELQRRLLAHPDPLFESILEITSEGCLFAPYRLTKGPGVFSARESAVVAAVGGCRIECRKDRVELAVDDGTLSVHLAMDLSGPPLATEPDGHMRAWSRPGCAARGTIAVGGTQRETHGTAWIDHAGGEWHRGQLKGRPVHPKWRRFAMTMDDGRSLVLWSPFPTSPDAPPVECRGHFGRPGEEPKEVFGTVQSHDFVVSARTHSRYEHEWTLDLPGLDGTLDVVPFHGDHEVAVFMLERGVLEAACRASGRLLGQPCTGRGFVEAFGTAPDINEFFWGQRKTHVAEQLERFMPRGFEAGWLQRVTGATHALNVDPRAVEAALLAPSWSMMDRGGKGWRSVWLMTCCHAFGFDDDARVRELLPVVEMLHTGSLVIDDIQDGATTRRGQPALHRDIGTPLAINVGCFLYFLPLVIVQEAQWLTDNQRMRVYEIILGALRQGHVGQGLDLMLAHGQTDLEARLTDIPAMRRELLEQYRLKSGGQLEAIARIAGVLSGAPTRWTEAAAEYSATFGTAFQIVDDIIDLWESREKLGKEPGEDVGNGKLDYLLLEAYAAGDACDRRELVLALTEGRDGVERARRVVQRTGAVERCVDAAEAMCEQAWRRLVVLPPTDAKIIMRSVPRWLLAERRRLSGACR